MIRWALVSFIALSLATPALSEAEGVTLAQVKKRKKRKSKAEKEAAAKAEEAAAAKAAEEEARKAAAAEAEAAAAREAAAAKAKAQAEAKVAAALEAKKRAADNEAKGLDARVRRLSDELARAVKALPGDHRDQLFAVLRFDDVGAETESRQLGLVVSDLVLTNLARDHRFAFVERAELDKVMQEMSLAAMGVTEENAALLSEKLGARAIVLGQVSDAGESFQVSARVVDASTKAVLATASRDLPKEELIAFSADAVVLRSKSGAMFRSLVAPGWGQVYNREPVKAGILGGTTAALAATSLGVLLLATSTEGAYRNFNADSLGAGASPQELGQASQQLRESAEAQFTTAALIGGVAAGAWLFTAFEAYLSGTDVDSLDAARARY